MGRLFGTDGVRGVAGEDLDARLALSVAAAAAVVLGYGKPGGGTGSARPAAQPMAVVGRDPRVSGEFLEGAVVAGLAERGVDVLRLGVVPTPAVAYLTDALGADFGVMLSASHNPAPDNGIKFFGRGGTKLPDEVEDQIEAAMPGSEAGPGAGAGLGFGRVSDAANELDRYLAHLCSTIDGRPLTGLRVVVDCAHGAAYRLAPRLLREAGAEVTAIGVEPDGLNINAGCGSTDLRALRAAVAGYQADVGIAYDGDADRCLAVDANGEVVDGDQILAILALALKGAGRLAGDTVVATVMANLGFRLAMAEAGIHVVQTPVGDRYLIGAMLDGRFAIGGEQSGHIIMLDHAGTGDGLLTSVQLLATMAASRRPLAELAKVMTKYPQVLVNVRVLDKAKVVASGEVAGAVAAAGAELGESGRVLVRPSGTEPAVRVMVEAVDSGQAEQIAQRLAAVVRAVQSHTTQTTPS
jgi:phosphoglucosamine mutase